MSHSMDNGDERPSKRVRVDESEVSAGYKEQAILDREVAREIRAGITAYVSPEIPGFVGTLKQRFTDFIVNEILPTGEVLHLKEVATSAKKQKAKAKNNEAEGEGNSEAKVEPKVEAVVEVVEISTEERAELVKLFSEEVTKEIERLYKAVQNQPNKKRRDFTNVKTGPIEDKGERTIAHQAIRRIFKSRLESSTGDDDRLVISKGIPPNNDRQSSGNFRGKMLWDELGGEYIHFTLYKENKDTMEILTFICSQLKMPTKTFQFAGTKDRRAVTSQRMSAYRVHRDRLVGISRSLRGAKIGDFTYGQYPLTLGELAGNEFTITLRDCHFPGEEGLSHEEKLSLAKSIVDKVGESMSTKGFINFYGLQRFGTFNISTDEVGKALLHEDPKKAVELILSYSPEVLAAAQDAEQEQSDISSDDRRRAMAIYTWETTKDVHKAIGILPRRFSAEANLMRHLGASRGGQLTNERDYQGAFGQIQRSMRLMYTHAYQSLVWNTVAGKRWETYGEAVVEGDLVVVETQNHPLGLSYDDSGEAVIEPAEDDKAGTEDTFTRARPLSKEEAESGTYTVFDIVLPLPGFDVLYPKNDIGDFYVEFMGSEAGGRLDPHNMRRKWKDISLSGGYRKLMAKPGHMSWEVKSYRRETQQFVETDLDRITKDESKDGSVQEDNLNEAEKIAVILQLQLGSSQYATIAIREMLKQGLKTHVPIFGNDR